MKVCSLLTQVVYMFLADIALHSLCIYLSANISRSLMGLGFQPNPLYLNVYMMCVN